jgi:CRP/FNR family transcriptional regulator
MNNIQKQLSEKFPLLEKRLIDEMSEHAEIKTIKQGETIIRSGQYIRSALLIIEGLVKIYREDEEGNEFFMYYLDGGKACAISLVCGSKQETSELKAKAITDTTFVSIPLKLVEDWMGKYKSWNEFALNSYRERFEELLQTIDHIAFRNMDERLLFYLKRHQEKTGSNIITNSFKEIAQELNSSREVISRLMKKLADKGFVNLHKSYVELFNLDQALT